MSDILKVALLQTPLHWEDIESNLALFDAKLPALAAADLIVLPEMFTTGFSMNPAALADAPEGRTLQWLREKAADCDAAICGSAIIGEGGNYYNRLYFVYPDGAYRTYDKRHLFSLAGEEKIYRPGKERLIVEFRGWRINPQICFDLRFPVWCRNDAYFDLQLFVANWPQKRSSAWSCLLQARAIENVCNVVGVNRIGPDGNDVDHSGDTALYDALGKKRSTLKPHQEGHEILELSYQELKDTRARFAFLEDRDRFSLELE